MLFAALFLVLPTAALNSNATNDSLGILTAADRKILLNCFAEVPYMMIEEASAEQMNRSTIDAICEKFSKTTKCAHSIMMKLKRALDKGPPSGITANEKYAFRSYSVYYDACTENYPVVRKLENCPSEYYQGGRNSCNDTKCLKPGVVCRKACEKTTKCDQEACWLKCQIDQYAKDCSASMAESYARIFRIWHYKSNETAQCGDEILPATAKPVKPLPMVPSATFGAEYSSK